MNYSTFFYILFILEFHRGVGVNKINKLLTFPLTKGDILHPCRDQIKSWNRGREVENNNIIAKQKREMRGGKEGETRKRKSRSNGKTGN